jgi:hypothetical protein
MRRRDLRRRDIQDQFKSLGYRANFTSNPLNKQIVTIEFATDTQPAHWIKRAEWNEQPEVDEDNHASAFDLAESLLGAFLLETGQKITP